MVDLNQCEDLLSYYTFNSPPRQTQNDLDKEIRIYDNIYFLSNMIIHDFDSLKHYIFYIIFASFYLNTNYYITGIGNSEEDCYTQDKLQKLIDTYKERRVLANALELFDNIDIDKPNQKEDILIPFWRLCSNDIKIIEYIIKTFFDGLAQYPLVIEIKDICGNTLTPDQIAWINNNWSPYTAVQSLIVNPIDHDSDDANKDSIKSEVIKYYKNLINPYRVLNPPSLVIRTTPRGKRISAPYTRGGKLTIKANKKILFKKTKKKKLKKGKHKKYYKSKKQKKHRKNIKKSKNLI